MWVTRIKTRTGSKRRCRKFVNLKGRVYFVGVEEVEKEMPKSGKSLNWCTTSERPYRDREILPSVLDPTLVVSGNRKMVVGLQY